MVAGCGVPNPKGAGGTGGTGGQDASPPPQCVSVAGRYLASHGSVVDQPVDVQQTNCDVSAVVPGFGSVTCTAAAPGVAPRLQSCSLHVDQCTAMTDFPAVTEDDGRAFSFEVWTRWTQCHGTTSGGTLVFALDLVPFTVLPTPLPEPNEPVSVSFSGLTSNGAPVQTYAESGVTITTAGADWRAVTNYGHPEPSLQFRTPAGEATDGTITVTAGGPFSFSSVDFYSSTSSVPVTIEGTLNSESVLWVTETLDSTGGFFTFHNPRPSYAIDTLVIKLSNASAPCCPNPMGVDNIVIRRPTPP